MSKLIELATGFVVGLYAGPAGWLSGFLFRGAGVRPSTNAVQYVILRIFDRSISMQ